MDPFPEGAVRLAATCRGVEGECALLDVGAACAHMSLTGFEFTAGLA
jgi:hypothetical protein